MWLTHGDEQGNCRFGMICEDNHWSAVVVHRFGSNLYSHTLLLQGPKRTSTTSRESVSSTLTWHIVQTFKLISVNARARRQRHSKRTLQQLNTSRRHQRPLEEPKGLRTRSCRRTVAMCSNTAASSTRPAYHPSHSCSNSSGVREGQRQHRCSQLETSV